MIKLQTFFSDTWTQLETLNLSRNQLTGLPVSEYYPTFLDIFAVKIKPTLTKFYSQCNLHLYTLTVE